MLSQFDSDATQLLVIFSDSRCQSVEVDDCKLQVRKHNVHIQPYLFFIQDGRTPLHICCIKGKAEMVTLLVEFGSNVTAKDKVCELHFILIQCQVIVNLEFMVNNHLNLRAESKIGVVIVNHALCVILSILIGPTKYKVVYTVNRYVIYRKYYFATSFCI